MNYFSKIEINPQRRESRKLLTNPQAMHASVLSLFPPKPQPYDRVLWRLDSAHPHHVLYIVSPEKPDFSHMNESIGWDSAPGQSLDYTKFLQKVKTGTEWLFRLQANPTKALHKGEQQQSGVRGKVIPLITEKQQLDWLTGRAPRYGFDITRNESQDEEDSASGLELRVVGNTELHFFKNDSESARRKVTLRKSVFEGKLVVTDELTFRKTLIGGLGRGKSYGFGLLTLQN